MAYFHPLLLLIPFATYYLYTWIRWKRLEQKKDIPQAPNHLLLGHMKFIGEAMGEVKAHGAGGQNHPGIAPLHNLQHCSTTQLTTLTQIMHLLSHTSALVVLEL
jgi:hypothetical protein